MSTARVARAAGVCLGVVALVGAAVVVPKRLSEPPGVRAIEPGLLSHTATAAGKRMSFTGTLTDAVTGAPLAGVFNLSFGIYDVASAGTARWSETHDGTSVAGGRFTVLLGSHTAFPDRFFDGSDRYLQINVNGVPLTPRVELARVASAFFSDLAADLDCVTACVSAVELAANAVVSGTIANGQIAIEDLNSNTVAAFRLASTLIGTADLAVGSVRTAAIENGTILEDDLAATTKAAFRLSSVQIGAADLTTTLLTDIHQVLAHEIAAGAVGAEALAAAVMADIKTVTSSELATDLANDIEEVIAEEIAAGAVTAAALAPAVVADIEQVLESELAEDLARDINEVVTGEIVDASILIDDLSQALRDDIHTVFANELDPELLADVEQVIADELAPALLDDIENVASGEIVDKTIVSADLADALLTDIKQVLESELHADVLDDINVVTLEELAQAIKDDIHTVATGEIEDAAVVSSKILDGTVGLGDLAAEVKADIDTVDAGEIATGAVVSGNVLDGTLSLDDLSDAAIASLRTIATGAVASAQIADGSITAADLAVGSITLEKIDQTTAELLRTPAKPGMSLATPFAKGTNLLPVVSTDFDGRPIGAYTDGTDLVFFRCATTSCTSASTATLALPTDFTVQDITVGDVTVGSDGLPLVTATFTGSESNRVAGYLYRCSTATCSQATSIALGLGYWSVPAPQVVIGTDGLAVVSLASQFTAYGGVWRCDDVACSSLTQLYEYGTPSTRHDLAVGVEGVPFLATVTRNGGPNGEHSLDVTKCTAFAGCVTNAAALFENLGNWWQWDADAQVAIGADGMPLITAVTSDEAVAYVVRCGDVACTPGASTVTELPSQILWTGRPHVSHAVGVDGLPVIVHNVPTDPYSGAGVLTVTRCQNPSCSASTSVQPIHPGDGTSSLNLSMSTVSIGTDGLPLLLIADDSTGAATGGQVIKALRCSNRFCVPHARF